MPALIRLELTVAQARSLLLLASGAEDRLPKLLPDGRNRSAAMHALDLLRDAVAGHPMRTMDLDLQAFADVASSLRSPEALALFESRLRDLLAVSTLWRGLEGAEHDARRRGDATAAANCIELLDIDAIDEPPWRADVVDLLDGLGVAVILPGERP